MCVCVVVGVVVEFRMIFVDRFLVRGCGFKFRDYCIRVDSLRLENWAFRNLFLRFC